MARFSGAQFKRAQFKRAQVRRAMGIGSWISRMLKDRQEILVLGELVLFLAAWGLGIAAAVDDNRVRTNAKARNNVAAITNSTEASSYGVDSFGADSSGADSSGTDSSGADWLGTSDASDANFRDSIGGELSPSYSDSMISHTH